MIIEIVVLVSWVIWVASVVFAGFFFWTRTSRGDIDNIKRRVDEELWKKLEQAEKSTKTERDNCYRDLSRAYRQIQEMSAQISLYSLQLGKRDEEISKLKGDRKGE